MSDRETDVFPVSYRIGNGLPGGQSLHVSLLVDPLHNKFTGVAPPRP